MKQYEIVALAVANLGGNSRAVDTEDIAVKAHELAPEVFSWRKYPALPNLELVRVALSDAKKDGAGVLLTGSGKKGWMLTKAGLDWVSRVNDLGDSIPNAEIRRTSGSVDTRRRARERGRIMTSDAWVAWISNNSICTEDAKHIFRIDQYASHEIKERKIVRLLSLFEDDSEIYTFLEAISEKAISGGEEIR